MRRLTTITTAALTLAAFAGATANAADQVVTGTVGSAISITSAPADVDLGALPATAASLGSITVDANAPYVLTAQAEQATMTSWDGTAYGTDALATSMLLTTTSTAGVGVGIPATAVTAAAALPIGTGVGLAEDTYSIAATQAVSVADKPGTYRNVITYTASAAL